MTATAMRRRYAPMTLAAGLLALALFALAGLATPGGAQQSLTVQLGELNASGQTGSAELTDLGGGRTRVVVTLSNPPAGVAQPAHIHTGTCASLDPRPLHNLTNVQGGRSETTVDVPLATLTASAHVVNVHKSAQEVAIYVACGSIPAATGMPAAAPRTGAGGPTPAPWLAVAGGLLALGLSGGLLAARRRV